MVKRYAIKRILLLMSVAGTLSLTNQAMAAAFQLWEQDGATVGNYHAGRAASAEDASTAFYNPAGLVRIKNQELVVGAVPIMTDFKFRGTVRTTTGSSGFFTTGDVPTTAQGGTFNIAPNFHYAAPLSDWAVFGLSLAAPFGLDIDYGYGTNMRYALAMASLRVYDLSPSLGVSITDKFSVGAGIDFEHAKAEFDSVATIPLFSVPPPDTIGRNIGSGNATGFHLGALYQYSDKTRYGLSYQSQIVHHLRGNSTFVGPLANSTGSGAIIGGVQGNSSLRANVTLPPTTAFSAFHTVNPTWDVMGTVQYTQWSVLQYLVLQNVSGAVSTVFGTPIASNSIAITVPEHYRNTWNFSAGANYHVNEKVMLRGGFGFDQTPSNDTDRNVILPDSNRIAIALGAHFQPTKAIGLDAGWTHLFTMRTRVNNPSNIVGPQVNLTGGTVTGSADVFGFQAKWDIA